MDFLLHVNWSFENDGFINLWINNRLAFHHKGVNSSIPYFYMGKKPGVAFRFGIYNGKRSQKTKPQIIYYDSFKRGNSCVETALWHNCENLPDNRVNSVKGKYRIKWYHNFPMCVHGNIDSSGRRTSTWKETIVLNNLRWYLLTILEN